MHKFLVRNSVAYLFLLVLGTVGSLLGPELLTSEAERSQQAVAQSTSIDDFSSNSPEEVERGNGVRTLLAIAALGGGAAGVIFSARKANNPLKIGLSQESSHEQASPQLQKKLLRLLHNDQATASRLLAQVKRSNPHQSINWAAEKAIYDLERDRH